MHGDFTPWNLRSAGRGPLSLVDWEDAGWGPPHADEVLYRAVSAALGGGQPVGEVPAGEAADFWIDRVGARVGNGSGEVDDAFGKRILEALGEAAGDRADA